MTDDAGNRVVYFYTERSDDRNYYLKDHLGSNRMTINSLGVVTNVQDYYAYGEVLRSYNNSTPNEKYKFTGKERDTETDLDYFGARYYDSELGRWTSIDPLASKYPQWSPYVYCLGNPIKFFDPNGKEVKAVHMKGRTGNDPKLKERVYYLDTKIADKVVQFANGLSEISKNLSINNTFRLENSSQISTKYTKAKGLSRHQAGFAIDVNGMSTLSKEQIEKVNELAKEAGLSPLRNQSADPPHFDADPTDYGYKSLKEVVEINKEDYLKKTKEEEKNEDEKKK